MSKYNANQKLIKKLMLSKLFGLPDYQEVANYFSNSLKIFQKKRIKFYKWMVTLLENQKIIKNLPKNNKINNINIIKFVKSKKK